MHIEQIKSWRVLIFLLLTVFLTNTVYASGMMSTAQLPANNSAIDHHAGDGDHSAHQNHDQKHEPQHSSGDHCSKSTHCMACFSFLSPSEFNQFNSQVAAIAILLFKPIYLSYISAQPQRPPIP